MKLRREAVLFGLYFRTVGTKKIIFKKKHGNDDFSLKNLFKQAGPELNSQCDDVEMYIVNVLQPGVYYIKPEILGYRLRIVGDATGLEILAREPQGKQSV